MKITDEHIGKYELIRKGFYSGLVGVIKRNTKQNKFTDYVVELGTGRQVSILRLSDVVLIDKEDLNKGNVVELGTSKTVDLKCLTREGESYEETMRHDQVLDRQKIDLRRG